MSKMEVLRLKAELKIVHITDLLNGEVFRYADGEKFYLKCFEPTLNFSKNAVMIENGNAYLVDSQSRLVRVKGKFIEEV